tara:strand:+ start:398 stop:559 length:162 start_codon:yes stop_codon:yes gene_type:complete
MRMKRNLSGLSFYTLSLKLNINLLLVPLNKHLKNLKPMSKRLARRRKRKRLRK